MMGDIAISFVFAVQFHLLLCRINGGFRTKTANLRWFYAKNPVEKSVVPRGIYTAKGLTSRCFPKKRHLGRGCVRPFPCHLYYENRVIFPSLDKIN
jgi:hypothetical protein